MRLEPVEHVHVPAARVLDGEPCERAVRLDDVDHAPVGDTRNGQARDARESAVVVERLREHVAGLGEEPHALGGQALVGDVVEDVDRGHDRAGLVAHGLRAHDRPQRVARLAEAVADRLLDVLLAVQRAPAGQPLVRELAALRVDELEPLEQGGGRRLDELVGRRDPGEPGGRLVRVHDGTGRVLDGDPVADVSQHELEAERRRERGRHAAVPLNLRLRHGAPGHVRSLHGPVRVRQRAAAPG